MTEVVIFREFLLSLLQVIDNKIVKGIIKTPGKLQLPSIQDGWRFNFQKHAKSKGAKIYILVAEETPNQIEGCLVYKMKDDQEPYMAYIEIAPHNRTKNKLYERIAGCLIAFACRLSFIMGKDYFKGWLAFDVQEEKIEDQKKLMSIYSKNYRARKYNETTMLIIPEDGESLIEEFLES